MGFTVTGPQQAATIDHALATGGFDTVQATWNLYERSAEGALERAHEAGLVVLIKEALANGRLVEVGAAEAFAAALARPWADVVLSGASTLEQLEGNLAARELVWTTSSNGASAAWQRSRRRTGRRAPSSPGPKGPVRNRARILDLPRGRGQSQDPDTTVARHRAAPATAQTRTERHRRGDGGADSERYVRPGVLPD